MKNILILGAVALILAGCGGSSGKSSPRRGASYSSAPAASGPISQACLASDRTARSRALCGCIQAVADQTLSASDQRRAVSFYADPHRAQEIRQSERASDERFWEAYRAYGARAEQVCS